MLYLYKIKKRGG